MASSKMFIQRNHINNFNIFWFFNLLKTYFLSYSKEFGLDFLLASLYIYDTYFIHFDFIYTNFLCHSYTIPHTCHLKMNTNTATTNVEMFTCCKVEIDEEYVSSSNGAGATLGYNQFSDGSS